MHGTTSNEVPAGLDHPPSSLTRHYLVPASAGWNALWIVDPSPGAGAAIPHLLRHLHAFRSYHSAWSRSASRVASALLEMEGVDVDAEVSRLGLHGIWRGWLTGPAPRDRPRPAAGGRWSTALAEADRLLFAGRIVRGAGRDALGIRLSPHGLEVGLVRGGFRLRTMGEVTDLTVAGGLPETVLAAAAGRPLASLLDHPALRDPGYVVRSARLGGPVGRRVAAFRVLTGRVAWTPPWTPR